MTDSECLSATHCRSWLRPTLHCINLEIYIWNPRDYSEPKVQKQNKGKDETLTCFRPLQRPVHSTLRCVARRRGRAVCGEVCQRYGNQPFRANNIYANQLQGRCGRGDLQKCEKGLPFFLDLKRGCWLSVKCITWQCTTMQTNAMVNK